MFNQTSFNTFIEFDDFFINLSHYNVSVHTINKGTLT